MLMAEIYSLFFLAFIVGLTFLSNYFLHRIDTKALLKSQEILESETQLEKVKWDIFRDVEVLGPFLKDFDQKTEKHHGSFIAERAYQQLQVLNDFGPKVVGSRANEILAAEYILAQVEEIKANASNPDDVSIDRQISSGFNFASRNYHNLQNIVVRLQGETDHAVMINCHFDSVPGSPGASDDNVNCCVMMEIFRVLSRSSTKQRHTVIFLFNGSEETNLQAAHAFITQQQWRESVRAYINLESTGSGGREILFRTGPKHDWLVKMYRESVPRPFGHVASEELFESGAIPSATDFQIFRDYGEIPGLDFAYVEDGWRYHTRYDSIDYISMESVQHTGNNILELTKKIANSNELVNPPEGTYAVYFDYLGLFIISYTASTGTIINYIIAILAFLIPFILQTKFKMENIGFVFFETIISMVTMVVSVVLAALACFGIAALMNSLDNTMSWYNSTFLSIGIYCSLALIVEIAVYHFVQIISRIFFKTKKYSEASKRHRVKINLNGVTLFWSIVTITMTAMGFRTTYIFMVLLFISLCTYLLTYLMCRVLSKTTTQSWIFVHIFGHSVSFLFCCYISLQIQQLFIPIAAKQFYENPDIMIALICVFGVTVTLSYFVPLTLLVPMRVALYTVLSVLFITCTILAFTPLGFPYSDAKDAPRLQRFRTLHIKRTHFHQNATVKSSVNDAIIYAIDRNAIRTLENAFDGQEFNLLRDDELCVEHFHCGVPDYRRIVDNRVLTFRDFNVAPNIEPTKFTLIQTTRNATSVHIEFSLDLKTMTYIRITPADGLKLESYSVALTKVTENQKDHFIGTITFGKNTNEPRVIEINLEGTPSSDVYATLNVITEDSTFDQGSITPEFKKIVDTLPDYTFSYVQQLDSSFYEIAQI